MDDKPASPVPAPGAKPYEALTKEALDRLATCETQKQEFDLDIREGYFFTNPHRAREIRSAQALSPQRKHDEGELQTGLGSELSADFVTVIVNAFMPPAEPWAERRPGMFLNEAQKLEAQKQTDQQDPLIFEAIRGSNLYEELPKAFDPDLSIGLTGLWIDDPRPAENIVVQAVPLHEIEVNLGPFGHIDDRFVVRHTRNRHVKALIGASVYDRLDAECRRRIEDSPSAATIIRWGFWRLWDRLDDVVWKHVVMLDREVVHAAEVVGEGSCPFIPIRFNPMPEWAYGAGPTMKSLPDFRQLDDLEGKKIEHVDMTIAPPGTYPNDSMGPIEGGVESGKLYPVRPGEGNDIKPIFPPGTMEPAIYEVSEIERRLRHRYFLDWPEQRGKTPPTREQWMDEMVIAQRRIGTPGMPFWREGPAEIFLRYKHLLEKRGKIGPITVNGKIVSLQPYNPAQQAAEMQEVATAARCLNIVATTWPEEFRLGVDGMGTIKNLVNKMRAKLIVLRDPEKAKGVIGQIMGLIQGRQRIEPPETGAPPQ